MGRLKILHRLITERNIPSERAIHRPHEHQRLIIHAHNDLEQIFITRPRHHISNILTHKRGALGMPPRRPRLSQMIRQPPRSIITHQLLGERKFTVEMILIRILRRLPRRRPRPGQHLLGSPPETRPGRRHFGSAFPIRGPLLIIPPRLIRIRRHMPPRNRRPTHAAIKTNRLRVIELGEPLKRGPGLRPRHPPHAPTRHTRITFSAPQLHAFHFPAHIRQRTAQTIRPLGDRCQFSSRTPILTTHSIT